MFEKRLKKPSRILTSVFLQLLILYFSFGMARGAAYPRQEREQRQALGSLTNTGEVYLNSAAALEESPVFAGDMVRTSPSGTAMFTLAGNGSLRISPNSEIVFTGGPQYSAELKLGKVVMNTLNGPMGITLRAGSSVVVAVAEGEQSTSSIEAPSDGSFLVNCLDGSVGVVPLQDGKGVFIHAGQSVRVSPQGGLSAMGVPAEAPAAASGSAERNTAPAGRQRHTHTRWILLGIGAAGAVTAAAILVGSGSSAAANTPMVTTSSASSGSAANNPPPPDPPAPPQPTPPQPQPQPPSPPPPPPPSQPTPPGGSCHHDKNCKPHVVIGFAFHF